MCSCCMRCEAVNMLKMVQILIILSQPWDYIMSRGTRMLFTACLYEARLAQDVVYVSSPAKDALSLPQRY